MNIRDVMGQENDGNRLRDLPLVLFGDSPLQDIDAERNHVHDPICSDLRIRHDIVAPASPAHQCSETSGAKARANWVVRWLVRAPEITQLFVNVAVSGIME
jgi:hypothetical protein